jgi:hypothetical protein
MADTNAQQTVQQPAADGSQSPPGQLVKKKFLNGWTAELEDLMADWADKAACYRWMHDKTSKIFLVRDRFFNIPVIILSGVTAGANFALGSIFAPDDIDKKKWAQLGLGGASLITGIIQTLMNFYGYAKNSEAHRVASISWGKFNRLLCIEMSLHPDERMDAFNFLKLFRVELDRLIEQSPTIPDQVIDEFKSVFKCAELVKPEIVGILNHTKVYKDTGARLKRIAAEATVALHYRRGVIKQLVVDDLNGKTKKLAEEVALTVAKDFLKQKQDEAAAIAAKTVAAAAAKLGKTDQSSSKILAEKQKEERQIELTKIAQTKAGSVAELRAKFKKQFEGQLLPPTVAATADSESTTIDSAISIVPAAAVTAVTFAIDSTTNDVIAEKDVTIQIPETAPVAATAETETGFHTPLNEEDTKV